MGRRGPYSRADPLRRPGRPRAARSCGDADGQDRAGGAARRVRAGEARLPRGRSHGALRRGYPHGPARGDDRGGDAEGGACRGVDDKPGLEQAAHRALRARRARGLAQDGQGRAEHEPGGHEGLAGRGGERSEMVGVERGREDQEHHGESLRKRLTPAGRIHARFNPFGTATGRFSSSGPNLQNIPKRGEFGKRMRGLFWSGSDDRVLIKADYASIELWLAAVRWEDPYMQKALQQGVNMHVATAAAALFNVKPGEALRSKNSQTHNERFPGLDQALEAPLRYAE